MRKLMTLKNTITAFALVTGFLACIQFLTSIGDNNKDSATMYGSLLIGIITVYVIYWQGSLIKQQIQFQTYLDLENEWNGPDLIEARQTIAEKPLEENFPVLESILEFLEKFALFKKRNALDMDFILSSTIGWYAVRYYHYNKGNIKALRTRYGEPSVYEDIEQLYKDYVNLELGAWFTASPKNIRAFELNLDNTRDAFFEGEAHN